MKIHLPKIKKVLKIKPNINRPVIFFFAIFLVVSIISYQGLVFYQKANKLQSELERQKLSAQQQLQNISQELEELKNQDPQKKNQDLQIEITNIQKTFKSAIAVYDDLIELRGKAKNTASLEEDFAESLFKLSQRDYSGATDTLNSIASKIKEEEAKLTASFTIPQNTPQSNAPPGSGYSRQSVNVEGLGSYLVSIVAADLSNTKVIVDTASSGDCTNDCPVFPLAEYVSRNGAFAGINGTYFCPADYASCAGKTNSFDLLVMNKDKTYFNSGNNVYSNNPAVIFGDGYIRFVSAASQWGRDTSPNGVLSNFPLLVANNQVVFGGDDDPKKGSKGTRSFVANKGNTVYIGVVHSATVAESARVLQVLGMENAMNLDNGGSTALWSGGYKVGPGRNLPNVILFVGK